MSRSHARRVVALLAGSVVVVAGVPSLSSAAADVAPAVGIVYSTQAGALWELTTGGRTLLAAPPAALASTGRTSRAIFYTVDGATRVLADYDYDHLTTTLRISAVDGSGEHDVVLGGDQTPLDFSSDGRYALFRGSGDLETLSLHDGVVTPVPGSEGLATATFDPSDSSRLIVPLPRGGSSDLESVAALRDGVLTTLATFFDGPGAVKASYLSPDGSTLAVARFDGHHQTGYVAVPIAQAPQLTDIPRPLLYSNEYGDETRVRWAPDSSAFFASTASAPCHGEFDCALDPPAGDVYRVPADGSAPTDLTNSPHEADVVVGVRSTSEDPSVPRNVRASSGASGVSLSWEAASGATRIYRNALTPGLPRGGDVYTGSGTSFTDATARPGADYLYTLVSVGADGQESPPVRVAVTPLPPHALSITGSPLVDVPSYLRAPTAELQFADAAGHDISAAAVSPAGARGPSVPWTTTEVGARSVPVSTTYTIDPIALSPGREVVFRARAFDAFGNDGPVSEAVLDVPYDDRAAHAGPGWTRRSDTDDYRGTYSSARSRGAWMSFRAQGRQLSILGARGSKLGAFTVYLDGRRAGVVDTHSAHSTVRATLWNSPRLRRGPHLLRIVASGTKGRPAVLIDGFSVLR